jgi:hypothetical protein
MAILKLFIPHILQSLAAKRLFNSALRISLVLYQQFLNLVYEHPEDGTDVPKNVKVAKDYNLNVSVSCQYCAGGIIEKNEMRGTCGAYGEGERCAQHS